MLVGTTNISVAEIEACNKRVGALKRLAISKVPYLFRHIQAIVDNQTYYLALIVRNLYKNDYNTWHPICTSLLEGIHVTGCVDSIYTCADLVSECNIKDIRYFLKKEV